MAGKSFAIEPFVVSKDHPLAAEHAAVAQWVEGAHAAQGARPWYADVEMKSVSSGKTLLDAKPAEARRIVLAAVQQVRYWDDKAEEVRAQGKNEFERVNVHFQPNWNDVWSRRRKVEAVISALMRRAIPFEEPDLLAILAWPNQNDQVNAMSTPVGSIVRSTQRFADSHPIGPELTAALRLFAERLRASYNKDAKRYATAVEQLCVTPLESERDVQSPPAPRDVRPMAPAPAGDPRVLVMLKEYVGVAPTEVTEVATRQTGLDLFPLREDSPLAAEHALLEQLFPEVIGKVGYNAPELNTTKTGKKILALDDAHAGRMLLAAAERDLNNLLGSVDLSDHRVWQSRSAASGTVDKIAKLPFKLNRDWTFDFLLYTAARVAAWNRHEFSDAIQRAMNQVEATCGQSPLTDGERYVLHLLRASMIDGPPLGVIAPEIDRLTKIIGDGAPFYLVPCEVWAEQVNADIGAMRSAQRSAWVALLKHALSATGARPTTKWLKRGAELIAAIDGDQFEKLLRRWFPLVNKGRTFRKTPGFSSDARSAADTMHEENAIVLRGLLWLIPMLKNSQSFVREVAAVAASGYRKVPGVGPRAVKVGNAAVYALSEIATAEAVGQLAMLKVRVKFGTAQKEVEKAFAATAAALGLPQDQIEEMGIPSYGLDEVGLHREQFGKDITMEMRVTGRDVDFHWLRADGKPQKSVPASVKKDHKEEWKELQAAAKNIAAMLPAQSERIDQSYLSQKRWTLPIWRDRYLDHPLVGTLTRRLIWTFSHDEKLQVGVWLNGQIVDVDDAPLSIPDAAEVQLWHPIGLPMGDVVSWRSWLERHEVRQPFKQAHREIYVQTDAERRTATYSNRFAAHILRQHQFNALCAARGWRNKLRLMVDDSYPPATRELPTWGLRAEFWIEGIGENYGQDTNDSGTYLRVATDQVRFYRTGAAANYVHAMGGGYTTQAVGPGAENLNTPLPLDQVPPLAFSEILRDVDLFVGVGSVGNDPTWQDGGPDGRYRTYWHNYSFGELSETAQTRKAVLERLLPRLTKIRDRCSLIDRFLVVRGELRTYKIHLGSGNILMEPNDQYLCIVQSRSVDATSGLFLPFEGDGTLSIILSKAFLLADDRKISDETITRQIAHR